MSKRMNDRRGVYVCVLIFIVCVRNYFVTRFILWTDYERGVAITCPSMEKSQ